MRRFGALLLVALLGGCGYSSRDNEVIGQVKKVRNATPLLCSDYVETDISLGVLRNGVGSMSTQDVWLYVPDPAHKALLDRANASGALVRVKYDEKRVTFCVEPMVVRGVEIVQ